MSTPVSIPAVSVTYARDGSSTRQNEEAIGKLRDGTIEHFRYDPDAARAVARTA